MSIYEYSNTVESAPGSGTRILKNIVVIRFSAKATLTQKQAAINAVDGEVIGGLRIDNGGYYFIRIPRDGTTEAAVDAAKTIETFPQVLIAAPEIVGLRPGNLASERFSLTRLASPNRPDALPPTYEQGCQAYRITVGRTSATLVPDTTSACGPIRIALARDRQPSFNATTRLLRVPIVLVNASSRRLKTPARLFAWTDSATVVRPANLALADTLTFSGGREASSPIRGTGRVVRAPLEVRFANADSVVDDSAGVLHGASVWRYDRVIRGPALRIGARTEPRWLTLRVSTGVQVARIVLHAQLEKAGSQISLTPPDTEPSWFRHDSSYFGGPGGYLKNVVSIIFLEGTSLSKRQAAIDLVGGMVIGGIRLNSGDGYYDLFIPDDRTGARLRAATAALNALPFVEDAGVVLRGSPGQLKRD